MNCAYQEEWLELEQQVPSIIDGTGNAFEFFHTLRRHVFERALAIMHHHHDAEDVTQITLFKIHRKLAQLQSVEKLSQWVSAIIQRSILNTRRAIRIQAGHDIDFDALEDLELAHTLECVDIREEVYTAMSSLPAADQTLLQEFYLERQSIKNLSTVYDAPIGTIKSRLHTARERLRAVFQAEF